MLKHDAAGGDTAHWRVVAMHQDVHELLASERRGRVIMRRQNVDVSAESYTSGFTTNPNSMFKHTKK